MRDHSLQCLSVANSMITDDSLLKLLKKLPDLIQLEAKGCTLLTDDLLEKLPSYCPYLEYLDISDNKNITNEGLGYIFSKSRLRHLIADGCENVNDATISMAIKSSLPLETLSINRCWYITGKFTKID